MLQFGKLGDLKIPVPRVTEQEIKNKEKKFGLIAWERKDWDPDLLSKWKAQYTESVFEKCSQNCNWFNFSHWWQFFDLVFHFRVIFLQNFIQKLSEN